jgi:hypothetical protein
MTQDFTRGYPIDLRPPERRLHLAAGPVGDFEGMAARVVARITGECVVIQDDGSKPAMPDIRIDYAGRAPAYVEVVVDVETSYAEMVAKIWKPAERIPADLCWQVNVTGRSNLKRLRRELPGILGDLHGPPDPSVTQQLAKLGAVVMGPWMPSPNLPAGIRLTPEGVYGSGAWPPFLEWIGAFLASDRTTDVRSKLAATGASERHAFIGASFTTPGDAYFALSREGRPELPDSAPNLPPEITHLWVWAIPGHNRCLAWFPDTDTGWLDVMDHWATP